ncbi:hypothetical protein ABZ575_30675, partial [Streptomyces sp. NPDC018347]
AWERAKAEGSRAEELMSAPAVCARPEWTVAGPRGVAAAGAGARPDERVDGRVGVEGGGTRRPSVPRGRQPRRCSTINK